MAGTTWGASQATLRTSALALCYSAAEYCAPVWGRSAHVSRVDVQLNRTMRIISGSLKSTPLPWLPVMASVPPPALRREQATQKQHKRIQNTAIDTPLQKVVADAPLTNRLSSRRPFYRSEKPDFSIGDAWRSEWSGLNVRGAQLVMDPTLELPGFLTLNRKQWTYCNRIRSHHGRTAANLHRWGYLESPTCPRCHSNPQDMDQQPTCPALPDNSNYRRIQHRS